MLANRCLPAGFFDPYVLGVIIASAAYGLLSARFRVWSATMAVALLVPSIFHARSSGCRGDGTTAMAIFFN
jgi:hypothetical protein